MSVEKLAVVTAGVNSMGVDATHSLRGGLAKSNLNPVLSDVDVAEPSSNRMVFPIKWSASLIQIMGYAATAFSWTPWNLYLFVIGVLGWFAVGVLWNDRAIMLIHIVALGAMVVGMTNG